MKIKELIKLLKDQDQNREVVLASDAEGNAYSSLYGVHTVAYDAEYGQIGLEELTDELISEGYGEDDVMTGNEVVSAIVLYPI